MNWLKKLSQQKVYPQVWQRVLSNDPMYSVEQAKIDIMRANEQAECCTWLQPLLADNPHAGPVKGLYYALECEQGINNQPKQMPQQSNTLPAGVTLKDENGQLLQNNTSSEGASDV